MAVEKTDREKDIENRISNIRIDGLDKHDSIYKYVTLDGKKSWNYFEQMLDKFQLVGTTPHSLNDPFEARPRIIDDLTDDKMDEICKFFNKDGKLIDARDTRTLSSTSEISVSVKRALAKLIEESRILSFCRRSDSPLLWSHYANSHMGACVHFTARAFPDADIVKGQVVYERHRPVVPLSLPASITLPRKGQRHEEDRAILRKELFKLCFFVKPLDWSYEEEVRFIFPSSRMTNVKFSPSGMFEIILGSRCSQDDEDRVRNIVKSSSSNVRVRKAFIDEDTFSVGIK